MSEKYTKARFWKCALQVNPAGYINYRGKSHEMSEEEYNKELLRNCREEGIEVIGLADHGNVDSVDSIREVMEKNNIVVFPGFEISSTEKAHFVCLFPENTTKDTLNRYLGALDLTDPADGVWPSDLGGNDLLAKVEELGGIAYAAHCTGESGVLFRKLNHVWKNAALKAAQIPGSLDGLKNSEGNSHRLILQNKNPDYRRVKPVAILNAKDIAVPDDLKHPGATCLIKMTRPCFESFKQAFLDSESRVRLNSDVPEKYFSSIETITCTGGYLDGVKVDFSKHLNAVIGGRGTGKSTLLECIRYALELKPLGKNALLQHDGVIRENIGGTHKAQIKLTICSSAMNGRKFTISRRYGESAIVKDGSGKISTFMPKDLLPRIEIYGQNEIYEIARDPLGQIKLLHRFLDIDNKELESKISEILSKLKKNRKEFLEAQQNLADVEEEVGRLPKLKEQVGQFKELGLEEKLRIVPKLEQEKQLTERIESDTQELIDSLASFKEQLPDTVYLGNSVLENLPHSELLKGVKKSLEDLKAELIPLIATCESKVAKTQKNIEETLDKLWKAIENDEDNLAEAFKDIPECEGRSGKDIGVQFQRLLKEIERIRPKEALLKNRQSKIAELKRIRSSLLAELSENRAERSAQIQRGLKRLNKKLQKKLKLTAIAEAERTPVVEFLQRCNLEGVGIKRLKWIETAEDFSPVKLAQFIRKGSEDLRSADWGMTPTVADALTRLSSSQVMELEELELPDRITIELNVAHEGAEQYRPLEKLSTGQQCTAILHLLLLENLDPLIMDQPEDNLDNAFIADRIVTELRFAKIARQFLFATHNANIPVFGDAEWIGVLRAEDNHAEIPADLQGAIDIPGIQTKAAEILEGGRAAFIQRKEKYGF